MKQEEFYNRLSDVPPVPDSIYPKIEGSIRQKRQKKQILFALAASVVIAAGIISYRSVSIPVQPAAPTVEVSDEIINELQDINDFIHGTDQDEEPELYALADSEFF